MKTTHSLITLGISVHEHATVCCLLKDNAICGGAWNLTLLNEKRYTARNSDYLRNLLQSADISIDEITSVKMALAPAIKRTANSSQALEEKWASVIRKILGYNGEIVPVDYAGALFSGSFDSSTVNDVLMQMDSIAGGLLAVGKETNGEFNNIRNESEILDILAAQYQIMATSISLSNGLSLFGDPNNRKPISAELVRIIETPVEAGRFRFAQQRDQWENQINRIVEAGRSSELMSCMRHVIEKYLRKILQNLSSASSSIRYCICGDIFEKELSAHQNLNNKSLYKKTTTPLDPLYASALGAARMHVAGSNPPDKISALDTTLSIDDFSFDLIAKKIGIEPEKMSNTEFAKQIVEKIHNGQIVAWYSGRREMSRLPLLSRSILWNPEHVRLNEHTHSIFKNIDNMHRYPLLLSGESVRTETNKRFGWFRKKLSRNGNGQHLVYGLCVDHVKNGLIGEIAKAGQLLNEMGTIAILPLQFSNTTIPNAASDFLKAALAIPADIIVGDEKVYKTSGQVLTNLKHILHTISDSRNPLNKKTTLRSRSENKTKKIGIWAPPQNKAKVVDFVKKPAFPGEEKLWSDTKSFSLEKRKKRIILVGESAARGFFNDPYKNVASTLRQICGESIEILDFARVSLKLDSLKQLCQDACFLRPDILIIYAGDTWRKNTWDMLPHEIEQLSANMDERPTLVNIKTRIHQKFDVLVSNLMNSIKASTQQIGCRVIVVIPAQKLDNWYSNNEDNVPSWPLNNLNPIDHIISLAHNAIKEKKWDLADTFERRSRDEFKICGCDR